jgi:flagellar motor switch/type III secretory pathway protein FliN
LKLFACKQIRKSRLCVARPFRALVKALQLLPSSFSSVQERVAMTTAAAPTPTVAKTASPVRNPSEDREEARWRPLLGMFCELTVDLPLPRFHVADLLQLRPGSVISTNWQLTRDVPLRVNGVLIAWGEFESTGKRLALRLTEPA